LHLQLFPDDHVIQSTVVMLSVVVHSFYVFYSMLLLLLENLNPLLFISLQCVAEHSWVKSPEVS